MKLGFIRRWKGLEFVTFKDEKSMKDAIEEMNGLDLDRRNITVNEAQSRDNGNGGGDGGFCSGRREGCDGYDGAAPVDCHRKHPSLPDKRLVAQLVCCSPQFRINSRRWSSSSRHHKCLSSLAAQLVAILVQLMPTATMRREDSAFDCGVDGGGVGVRVGGDSGYYSCKLAKILYCFAVVFTVGCSGGL
ncbi:Gly-rich RNA binding [Olea europaea subsp. europaea]|uniref:Gly-rich RNA binding, partial n=1 Tax=Olea europaea subsp. europaea TaxID=158383 RepID=A0A8S0QB64_OLEEU|nr:Gly-rich RNA binding [Olea europaea subsp. europaea]